MGVSDGPLENASRFTVFADRHYRGLAVAILVIAAFNLFFRLNREIVTEWDESLYAISAAETAAHGNWIATTFGGQLDYYNTKPPLNIWLIAGSFKTFGASLTSLRLPSALAAWMTILVLMLWARRSFGAPTALVAGLVLSTTFGFIYVHSGRSANTDALFTLLMLLVVITLWTAHGRPWRLVWLGPLVAAVFLLRGMAALMPLAMIVSVEALGGRRFRDRAAPLVIAVVLMAAPISAWIIARWQVDHWRFLERMFHYDFVARSATALEGHTGTLLYYPNVLQKDQYDWLLAAVAALVLFPVSWQRLREIFTESPDDRYLRVVAGSWIGVTLVIPTVMRTKVAWYLNPFFPIFALLVARTLAHGASTTDIRLRRRRRILAGLVLLAFGVAEGKLLWYSHNVRDLRQSAQGLLLEEQQRLAGRRVFRDHWPHSGRFVVEHLVGAEGRQAHNLHDFIKKGRRGDYLVLSTSADHAPLVCVRSNARYTLCEHPGP